MTDLIFVVSNPYEWHGKNRSLNPSHYSFPWSFLDHGLQDSAARIFYNADIRLPTGMRIKYGVMGRSAFEEDLRSWQSLYVAGRLHKPIHILSSHLDEETCLLLRLNRKAALTVAQLMLPERFTQEELLRRIISLSYLGDFRMQLAEDPQKVDRILHGQRDKLWDIYAPLMEVTALGQREDFQQEKSPMELSRLLSQLPINLQQRLQRRAGSIYELVRAPKNIPQVMSLAISDLVRWPALTQALKGIVTAGPSKSIYYAFAKLGRRLIK